MFQADGTVSKIESFRGDCKGWIDDYRGNRRKIKSQGKIRVPWKSLVVRKTIKIAHPKKDRPFKANDYKSAIYTARQKAGHLIHYRDGHEHCQRIRHRNAVDAIHKVDEVRLPNTKE